MYDGLFTRAAGGRAGFRAFLPNNTGSPRLGSNLVAECVGTLAVTKRGGVTRSRMTVDDHDLAALASSIKADAERTGRVPAWCCPACGGAWDYGNACCNKECRGIWGTGCYHCHYPDNLVVDGWEWRHSDGEDWSLVKADRNGALTAALGIEKGCVVLRIASTKPIPLEVLRALMRVHGEMRP